MSYQVELQDGRLIKRHVDHLRKKYGPSHHSNTPAELVDSPSTARQPESVTQPEERTAPVGPNVPKGPYVDSEAMPTEGSPGPEDTSPYVVAENMVTDRQTHKWTKYRNPCCACAPTVNEC